MGSKNSVPRMPRPRQKISIISLAKEFGVSAATISKALSNSSEISESLRGRIRTRADDLGFSPKRPRRTTRNICVVLDLETSADFSLDGFRRAAVEGVYNFCNERQTEFSLFGLSSEKLDSMDLTRELCRRNVDAAVIIGAKEGRKYFTNLSNNRFPFACVYDGPAGNTIKLDDLNVGVLALNHLVDLGHKRLAIARNMPGRHAFAHRFMGFIQAAKSRDLPADAVIALIPQRPDAGYEWGREILREWINRERPWSAIFCTSKNVAMGILSEASLQKIRIPCRLSVLTCDDSVTCAQAAPPLSVVDIPNHRAGYLAALDAWETLTGHPRSLDLNTLFSVEKVIHRASTAPPQSDGFLPTERQK